MEFQRVYPGDDNSIIIRCPSCMTSRVIPSQKIPRKYRFKEKCKCGSVFGVQFELRKAYRKDVSLDGILSKPEQNTKWGRTLSESQVTKVKETNCTICNISLGGIGLRLLDRIGINEDDIFLLKFVLDNSASTKMEKKVIVREVKDDYVGCEFLDSEKNDTILKFYFL